MRFRNPQSIAPRMLPPAKMGFRGSKQFPVAHFHRGGIVPNWTDDPEADDPQWSSNDPETAHMARFRVPHFSTGGVAQPLTREQFNTGNFIGPMQNVPNPQGQFNYYYGNQDPFSPREQSWTANEDFSQPGATAGQQSPNIPQIALADDTTPGQVTLDPSSGQWISANTPAVDQTSSTADMSMPGSPVPAWSEPGSLAGNLTPQQELDSVYGAGQSPFDPQYSFTSINDPAAYGGPGSMSGGEGPFVPGQPSPSPFDTPPSDPSGAGLAPATLGSDGGGGTTGGASPASGAQQQGALTGNNQTTTPGSTAFAQPGGTVQTTGSGQQFSTAVGESLHPAEATGGWLGNMHGLYDDNTRTVYGAHAPGSSLGAPVMPTQYPYTWKLNHGGSAPSTNAGYSQRWASPLTSGPNPALATATPRGAALSALRSSSISGPFLGGSGPEQPMQTAPTLHAGRGAVVPGPGNKDVVPAMLTPGEVVLNKKEQRAVNPTGKLPQNIAQQIYMSKKKAA